MRRYAVIGSGGREQAISRALAKTVGQENVFTLNGNAGIANAQAINFMDFEAVRAFCVREKVDTIVAGSEAVLVKGLYDFFLPLGIQVFGASEAAAQLEGSKIYAKQFMARYGVKTAAFVACQKITEAADFVAARAGQVVIKYDGLAAGKGVYVCDNEAECAAAFAELQGLHGVDFPFIAEEKLIGDELSIIAFTDGQTAALLLPAQDHKQIFDGDKGANTGGMGVYCPVHWCNSQLLQEIHNQVIAPTLTGIKKEGFAYKGFIYFGIMATADGAYNLEYNVRLGDPEAQVLLPSLATPLTEVIDAALAGQLDKIKLSFERDYFVDVVKTAEGYPQRPKTGAKIEQTADFAADTLLFYSGVARGENGGFVTAGGRVLNVVARAASLSKAVAKAYEEVEKIDFEHSYFRRDIAQRRRQILPKLGIFISGRGSNMQAIYAATQAGGSLFDKAEVAFVFANKSDAAGLAWAQAQGLKTYVLTQKKGENRGDYDQRIIELLAGECVDYLLLAGYMRILSPEFVAHYKGRIFNIHPADTRLHQGADGYEWAWENKLASTKITVHNVDAGLDTGEILAQYEVDLLGCGSLDAVYVRGLAVEHRAYAEAIAGLLSFDFEAYEGAAIRRI